MPEFAFLALIVFVAALGAGMIIILFVTQFRTANVEKNKEETARIIEDQRVLRDELSRKTAIIAEHEADLRNSRERNNELRAQLESKALEYQNLMHDFGEMREKYAQKIEQEKYYEKRLKDIADAKEAMKNEFSVIADNLMKSHGRTFTKQNKDQVEVVLKPFKDQIEKFENDFVRANRANRDQHVALTETIKGLAEQSAATSEEARNLTRALKGNVQTQGAWGEIIVETILQRSGLREGEEYTRQETHIAEDGSRPRTDYIVNLPNGERVIIDSKVSLNDFEKYAAAEDERERAARLSALASSIKNHIKALSDKEYHTVAGRELDFVIMFLPIEPAWSAALQRDQELIHFAADNKVAIATPTTLTTALKTISSLWRIERQNQNAEEIAVRAGKIYDKFVGFISDMDDIGNRLKQAGRAHDNAIKKLSNGRGNVVSQLQALKDMGAKTNKAIPEQFVEDGTQPQTLGISWNENTPPEP